MVHLGPRRPGARDWGDGNRLLRGDRDRRPVIAAFSGTEDPRLARGPHLVHTASARLRPGTSSRPRPSGRPRIAFLTAVGHMSDQQRQEFVLLSDVMGGLDAGRRDQQPEAGRRHRVDGARPVPRRLPRRSAPLGDSIAADASRGTAPANCLVRGQVVDLDGGPVAHATLDVWQADAEGFYDVQKNDAPEPARAVHRRRPRAATGSPPSSRAHYPIPDDGPVGDPAPALRPAPLPAGPHPPDRRPRSATSR